MTGESPPGFRSDSVDWGNDHENDAMDAYQLLTGLEVTDRNNTFAWPHELDFMGASPDAYVGEHGLLEIKCPFTGPIPSSAHFKYILQCHAQMLCTGRDWTDLCYWRPLVTREGETPSCEPLSMSHAVVIYRIHRDDELLNAVVPVFTQLYAMTTKGIRPQYDVPLKDLRKVVQAYLAAKHSVDAGRTLVAPDCFYTAVDAESIIKQKRTAHSFSELNPDGQQ